MGNEQSQPTISVIDDKRQKRAGRTLARAVSLHLEGNREGAAEVLVKSIHDGEEDPAAFSALGHLYWEKGDHDAAAEPNR